MLFCDTNALVTAEWSRVFVGHIPPGVADAAHSERYNLTLLTSATRAWVQDGERVQPEFAARLQFQQGCEAFLRARDQSYVVIDGANWDARFAQAVRAVEGILAPGPLPRAA